MFVNSGGGDVIEGDPVVLGDAAAAFVRAGSAFATAGEDIALHGRVATAQWTGAASQLAGAAITSLAVRTFVGADICAAVGPILTTYAAALRAAQSAHVDGQIQAAAGQAGAEAAMVAVDLHAAQSQAAAGVAAMVAATTAVYEANVLAAAAITELTVQTEGMGLSTEHNRHGAVYNVVGGLGDALWQSSIGMVGMVDGWIPLPSFQTDSQAIQHGHDVLESWYGADTDSDNYTMSEGAGNLAAAFIPFGGVAKELRAGEEAADGVRSIKVGEAAVKSEDLGVLAPPADGGSRIHTRKSEAADKAVDSRTGSTEPYAIDGPGSLNGDWLGLSGVLKDAAKGKGNFGLGSGTQEQANTAGQAWVGNYYRIARNGKMLISQDGLRQFRPPSYKPSLNKWQANFESRLAPDGKWQTNGHLDVTDLP